MIDVEVLFRRFGPMVHRRCQRILRDEHEAEDATQDVFVRLVRAQADLVDDKAGPLLWVMATQVSLNRLRSKKRKPTDGPTLLDDIAGADDVEERTLLARTLEAIFADDRANEGAVTRVSTRTLAVLKYVDGMTHDEVAATTGLSVGGVKKRLAALQQRVAPLRDAS